MKEALKQLLQAALDALRAEKRLDDTVTADIHIERTRQPEHGDFASNLALLLAKPAGENPRKLATLLVEHLPEHPQVRAAEIAGPGFINFRLATDAQFAVIKEILEKKERVGENSVQNPQRIHIEYVSSNPTGPLHVGHGRSAAFGSALANLLEKVGHTVHREYYVNDAGRQMQILAVSVWLRYLALFDITIDFPEAGYQGEYVNELATQLKAAHSDNLTRERSEIISLLSEEEDKDKVIDSIIAAAKQLLGQGIDDILSFSLKAMLEDIRVDLEEFQTPFDEWFSEKSLISSQAITHALETLEAKGHTYKAEGATWFKSSAFGDDKDRVLIRANGQSTYFASDVAYHLNKVERGFDAVVDVLGADHHGYVPRVRAVIQALCQKDDVLSVPIIQFVSLFRGKEKIPMSTRGGNFVTLRALREEVGNDAARYFYLMRKKEQALEFDLELAKSKSNDNPVYYIQYAHARICSIWRQLDENNLTWETDAGLAHLSQLDNTHETALVRQLSRFTELLLNAANQQEPSMLANYLHELAGAFHTYYNASRFIIEEAALRNARLCLIAAVQQILYNGLTLLGITAPERM